MPAKQQPQNNFLLRFKTRCIIPSQKNTAAKIIYNKAGREKEYMG